MKGIEDMLSGKQKRYLRSMAQTMNATFQVGKDGVSKNMIDAIGLGLEANELVKIKVLDNCMEELNAVALDLSAGTKAEIVQIIGHTIILYRPSKKNIIRLP